MFLAFTYVSLFRKILRYFKFFCFVITKKIFLNPYKKRVRASVQDIELWYRVHYVTCLLLLHQLSPGSPSHWACSLIWMGTQGSGLNNENNMSRTLKAVKNGLLKEIVMKSK